MIKVILFLDCAEILQHKFLLTFFHLVLALVQTLSNLRGNRIDSYAILVSNLMRFLLYAYTPRDVARRQMFIFCLFSYICINYIFGQVGVRLYSITSAHTFKYVSAFLYFMTVYVCFTLLRTTTPLSSRFIKKLFLVDIGTGGNSFMKSVCMFIWFRAYLLTCLLKC